MHKLHLRLPQKRRSVGDNATFTLVELALILTVLVALAAIILPVIYRGSRHAKTVLCTNNLMQLGTWANMYSFNNNDYLPAYQTGWVALIAEQGNLQVNPGQEPPDAFNCPSQPHIGLNGQDAAATWRGSHYGINQHIASNLTGPAGEALPLWTQISTRSIKDPSSKVLMGDTSGSNYFGLSGLDPTIAGMSRFGRTDADALPPEPAQPFPYHRHLDGITNILMLDGRAHSRTTWPTITTGPGTYGFRTWHGEHVYPGSGREVEDETE